MNKTFFLFPLRFENIIYTIVSYIIALTLIVLFENTMIAKFLMEILKFSYPISSLYILILLGIILYKEKNIFKDVFIPSIPLIFSWGFIYVLIYIFL